MAYTQDLEVLALEESPKSVGHRSLMIESYIEEHVSSYVSAMKL